MKKFFGIFLSALMLVACGTTKSLPSTQSSSTTYKIGDPYNQNGVKGIVVKVDDSGNHGLIMSIEASNAKWISDSKVQFETNAFYESDGIKNMEAIASYIASGKATWDDFPLMKWARSLGDGWYIPSKDEALEIWINMNGGKNGYTFSKFNKNDFQKFDAKQRSFGGDPLVDDRFYIGNNQPYYWYTSTEGDGGMVYSIQFGNDFKSQMTIGFSNSKFTPILTNKRPPITALWKSRAIHSF